MLNAAVRPIARRLQGIHFVQVREFPDGLLQDHLVQLLAQLKGVNRLLTTDEAHFGETAEMAGKGAVLVVEDCEPLLFYLNSALLQIGFQEIYLAASLEEAFAVWEQHKSGISHVLLNHGLPDGVGYELASKVLEDRPKVSVVITTGGDLASIQEEAANPNSFKYLQKPFRYTELRDLIQPPVQVSLN